MTHPRIGQSSQPTVDFLAEELWKKNNNNKAGRQASTQKGRTALDEAMAVSELEFLLVNEIDGSH